MRLLQGPSRVSVGHTACKVLGEHWSVSIVILSPPVKTPFFLFYSFHRKIAGILFPVSRTLPATQHHKYFPTGSLALWAGIVTTGKHCFTCNNRFRAKLLYMTLNTRLPLQCTSLSASRAVWNIMVTHVAQWRSVKDNCWFYMQGTSCQPFFSNTPEYYRAKSPVTDWLGRNGHRSQPTRYLGSLHGAVA